MKLYLSVDMEGITGLPDHTFVESSQHNYERARRIMTNEANAIIESALQQGTKHILVNDSHSSMTNILVEDLHPEANLITGARKPFSMVQSLEETFSGIIFSGYHARAGQPGAMSHTISLDIRSVFIDDIEVGEIGMNAYVAGYFGVPVLMIAGDDRACQEAKELMPHIITAPLKKSITRSAVETLHPVKANQLLKEKVKKAINHIHNAKPLIPPENPVLRVEFANYGQAENASLMPGCELAPDAPIVTFKTTNMLDAYRAMLAMARLASDTTYS